MPDATEKIKTPERLAGDRRSSLRFPLSRVLKHHGIGAGNGQAGCGETINISSRGVLFKTAERVRRGEWLELAISWPAQLNPRVKLQLVARGPVVRIEEGQVALAIQQHEFRTQPAASASTGADSPSYPPATPEAGPG